MVSAVHQGLRESKPRIAQNEEIGKQTRLEIVAKVNKSTYQCKVCVISRLIWHIKRSALALIPAFGLDPLTINTLNQLNQSLKR